jgi:hypothetical protein
VNPDFLPEVAHSILLYQLLKVALIPSLAIFGAKLMELWPVICSITARDYNEPNNSRYITVFWKPRLWPEVAHSILLYLLLMGALNPSRAMLGAKPIELWPVICRNIGLYYK